MKKLLGLFVAVLVSVGLTGGMVAANSGSIGTTGAESDNWVHFEDDSDVDLDNDTDVDANIDTEQDADSGDASAWYNTTGGDATSGDAENMSEVEAELEIDNSGSSEAALAGAGGSGSNSGTIQNTGYSSNNHILFSNNSSIDVDNDTDVDFDNDVDQEANSGNASVKYNTTGGNATSGSASNSSSTVFSLSVTN